MTVRKLRHDGRAADEMRRLEIVPGFMPAAEGSALVSFGGTRVICTASVLEGAPRFLAGSGSGWVTAEYAMLPRSTSTRVPRDVSRGRPSGRTSEIQRLIGRSLRAVTRLEALGEVTLWIDCDVIQADGGTRTASVTGGFVALALALATLRREKKISTIPLTDSAAAVSVGIVNHRLLLDLDYVEDSQAQVDLNLVATGGGRIVEVQGTAEKDPFSRRQLSTMLGLGMNGLEVIRREQRRILRRHKAWPFN